ncbi:dephospho-CoA kinase [Mycoplasma hafezii]|uniref:dephospho-CoA kinase n=1 Tax=Mycoplasma hafezii TaxID=525886 RepID=UPI003CED41E7
MIAVVGKICAGKTFVLKELEQEGYSVFYADEYVNNLYEKNTTFLSDAKNMLPTICFENNQLNKAKLKEAISQGKIELSTLEQLVFRYLENHLKKNKYDFAEIPILYKTRCEFIQIFQKIVAINTNSSLRQSLCEIRGVDNFWFNYFETQNHYNWDVKDNLCGVEIVNISINNKWELENLKNKLVNHSLSI